jgi:hypothetical protein
MSMRCDHRSAAAAPNDALYVTARTATSTAASAGAGLGKVEYRARATPPGGGRCLEAWTGHRAAVAP